MLRRQKGRGVVAPCSGPCAMRFPVRNVLPTLLLLFLYWVLLKPLRAYTKLLLYSKDDAHRVPAPSLPALRGTRPRSTSPRVRRYGIGYSGPNRCEQEATRCS